MGVGLSTQVPLSDTYLFGQVHTGPLGLSRHSHSHFFLSHGLVTAQKNKQHNEVHETENIQHHAGCRIVLTLWLLVAVVEDYIRSVVDACGEILHCAFAKLVHPEDNVIDIGDTIYVVLKYVYAEWMEQIWTASRSNQLNRNDRY